MASFSPLAQAKASAQVLREDGRTSALACSPKQTYGLEYFLKGSLAGGICCAITHGGLCPVDVVKTRIQLQPEVYNKGFVGGFRQVIAAEGVGALATGLGPTVVGYFVQGWFKFGGVEFFKINMANAMGEESAWKYRTPIYLVAAACAEFIADIFLCPLEATRIRLVANPTYASGLLTAFPKIASEDGFIKGFYSGFGPILFKQVPYTMAKFAVQGKAAEAICGVTGVTLETASDSTKLAVALSSGTIAGVAAAIISHPADTLLSLINKSETAGGTGSITSRLFNLANEVGFRKLCLTGLGARCIMIGSLTAGQFAIFDTVMAAHVSPSDRWPISSYSLAASRYRSLLCVFLLHASLQDGRREVPLPQPRRRQTLNFPWVWVVALCGGTSSIVTIRRAGVSGCYYNMPRGDEALSDACGFAPWRLTLVLFDRRARMRRFSSAGAMLQGARCIHAWSSWRVLRGATSAVAGLNFLCAKSMVCR